MQIQRLQIACIGLLAIMLALHPAPALGDPAYDDYVRAQRCVQNGQWNPAVNFLTKSINSDPKYLNAYIARGFAFSRLGKTDLALADYEKVLAIAPQNSVALSNKGFCLYLMGNLDDALVFLNKAQKLDPERPDILANRGEVYYKMGYNDKAIADCSKAIIMDDADADCYITRGSAYIKTNKSKEALTDLSKAISLNPDPVHMFHPEGESYYLRGQLYTAMGKKDLAARDFDTSQSLRYAPPQKTGSK